MKEISVSSHDDPLKSRVLLNANFEDKGLSERASSFVTNVLELIPKILHLYITGSMVSRKIISDWFFSLDLESLQNSGEEHKLPEGSVMERLGFSGKKLRCNRCNQILSPAESLAVSRREIKKCPNCFVVIDRVV